MKLTLEQKRQIVGDEIKTETERWRVAKKYPKTPTKPPKPPTPIQKLGDFLANNPFSCRTEKTREVAELILAAAGVKDHKIPGRRSKKASRGKVLGEIPSFTAVVPVMEDNDHDYPLEKAAIALNHGWDGMLRITGTRGNTMSSGKNCSRPATTAEIDEFVARMAEKKMDQLFEFDVIERLLGRATGKPSKAKRAPAKKGAKKKKKATKRRR